MTTEAIAASLPRPESDLDGSSSYVPSLVSPTERDSLDEGYDPDETLKVTVYDNEQIQFKSSGMFYEDVSSTESESEDDDDDVVVMYDNDNLNVQATDDNEDVVYISSGNQSSHQSREDLNANNVIQLHQSYDDSADVELHNQEINRNIQLHSSYDDSADVELIGNDNLRLQLQKDLTLEQLDNNSILEIEPSKFSMVKDASQDSKDEDRQKSIELVDIKHRVDYGELDKSASIDSNVKVCTEILKGINFDNISLSSLQNLRAQNKKLRRMSNITSLDSDTKVFNEIWNAVKQDKFEGSQPNSLDSDSKVFQVLKKYSSLSSEEKSLPIQSQTIPEESPVGSVHSWTMPENPGASPVFYPGGQVAESATATVVGEKLVKMDTVESEKSKESLREHCTIRDGSCSCEVRKLILESTTTTAVSQTVVVLIVFVIFMAFNHEKVTHLAEQYEIRFVYFSPMSYRTGTNPENQPYTIVPKTRT